MELQGETLLLCPPTEAWAALQDPVRLQRALPGCESLEAGEPGCYTAVQQLSVGPLRARFQVRLELFELQPPLSFRVRAQAQGGAAGHGRGEAWVSLRPEGEQQTHLHYRAELQVGGKLAQLGARLIEPSAQQLTQAFFAGLARELTPVAAAVPAPAPEAVPLAPPRPWWQRLWQWLQGRRYS